jgi:glycine cleavage system transcriptional repressor
MLGGMSLFALSAIGRDRPGIVAAISRALLEVGGNIEDSQMSILRGHFAVMLIVEVPAEVSLVELRDRLGEVRDELGLEAIALSPVDELAGTAPRPSHILTVYGADRPGIVHAVSSALAKRGVSITGLQTRLAASGDSPIYVMQMEIAVGAKDPEGLDSALREIGARDGLDVSLRELEVDAP